MGMGGEGACAGGKGLSALGCRLKAGIKYVARLAVIFGPLVYLRLIKAIK